MSRSLIPQPLTAASFAPYGNVIEGDADTVQGMNASRFQRYDALARLDLEDGVEGIISIAECLEPSSLPYTITLVERHPRGSQAFIPLAETRMIIVVAPAGDSVRAQDLRAFVSDGRQGIQYHRGTWHMPLIAFTAGQRFLIVDADDDTHNCDELTLARPVELMMPETAWP